MRVALSLIFALWMGAAVAQSVTPRDGWVVMPTSKPYAQLVTDVVAAVKANKMGVVTQAGPTGAAKKRGIDIPGSRIIGIFNNVYRSQSSCRQRPVTISFYISVTIRGREFRR